jgi:SAM-dependent methyltransferase
MGETMKGCEICGSEKMRYLFTKEGFDHQQCCVCGLIRVYPQPTDAELDIIYSNPFYGDWGVNTEDMKKNTFIKILSNIPRPPPTKSIYLDPLFLDIGANSSLMMECANERGYQVYGIEASKDKAAMIAKQFGEDRVFSGYFDENFSKWDGKLFDVVSMYDLFEHVRNPNVILDKVNKLLKDGGYTVIYTPDSLSPSRLVMGKRWYNFLEEHLFIFSRRNIKEILKKHGFEVIKVTSYPKFLNVNYLLGMFISRGLPFKNIWVCFFKLIPKFLRNVNIPIFVGEMFILAKKPASKK